MNFQQCAMSNWVTSCCIILGMALNCTAQEVARVSSAIPFSVKGEVEAKAAPSSETGTAKKVSKSNKSSDADQIEAGGTLSTGANSAASVILGGVGKARMGANTEIKIPDAQTKEHSLEMLKGQLFLNISAEELKKRNTGEFKLKTPAALLAVKGTRFFAVSQNGTDTIGVVEGSVSVTEPTSNAVVTLAAGQVVDVSNGKFSETRPANNKESDFAAQSESVGLVQTLLGVTFPQQKPTQMFRDGKLQIWEARDSERLLNEWEYVKVAPYSYDCNKTIKTSLTQDGMLSYKFEITTKESIPVERRNYPCYFNFPLHIKGVAWRAKNLGLQHIGKALAVKFRVRCRNVAEINSVFSGDLRDQGVTVHAPPTLLADGFWLSDCIVPINFETSGEDSSKKLIVKVKPTGLFATRKVTTVTVEMEIGDFSFLSISK